MFVVVVYYAFSYRAESTAVTVNLENYLRAV